MFPKSKKEKCKIAIRFLCKEQVSVTNVFKTKDSLLEKRDKFHCQLSDTLESFDIRYDDVFEVFDEFWQYVFDGKDRNLLRRCIDSIKNSFWRSTIMSVIASPVGISFVELVIDMADEAAIYSKRYAKYVELVEITLMEYIDKYEDGEG